MERAMSYIYEGGKKISAGLKDKNVMEVEATYNLVEIGKEKENDAGKRLCESAEEREKVQIQLIEIKKTQKLIINWE